MCKKALLCLAGVLVVATVSVVLVVKKSDGTLFGTFVDGLKDKVDQLVNPKKPPSGSVEIGGAYFGFFTAPLPFKLAEAECVKKNYTHLAEFHTEQLYTQVGFFPACQ